MTKTIFNTVGILIITFLILCASYVVNLFLMKPLSMDHYLAKELVIELIDSPEAMLGDKFDIKDFHSAVLDHGNPPLFVVEKIVNKIIEEAKF